MPLSNHSPQIRLEAALSNILRAIGKERDTQMRREAMALTFSAILLAGTLSVLKASAAAQAPQAANASASYGKLPLTFEANRGQVNPSVRYLARSGRY